MKLIMNEQEVCSTLHGFAKMSTNWDELSDAMRRSMLVSIASLSSVGALCLACTIYSLGMLGATWDRLPLRIRESMMISAGQRHMQDQTISNVIYGLSMLKASWATLEPEFREVLLKNLAAEDAFLADISQVWHTSIFCILCVVWCQYCDTMRFTAMVFDVTWCDMGKCF